MATANALNHAAAAALPQDEGPAGALIERAPIVERTRVAMVGLFPPVARLLTEMGALVEVVDDDKGMGDQRAFRGLPQGLAEVLVMTSTTLLGDTVDDLLLASGPEVRIALLGPTTPLVPGAFEGSPVGLLAGMVPLDATSVQRAVRHGAGAPELQRFCRKVYCVLPAGGGARS